MLCFAKKPTFLPTFLDHFCQSTLNIYDWHNLGYYGKDFTFIQGKD